MIRTLWTFFFPERRNAVAPSIQTTGFLNQWKLANAVVGFSFLVFGLAQLDDWEWWLWTPFYFSGALLAFAVAIKPRVVERYPWRYLCASTIILGMIFILYLFWMVREISQAYIHDPTAVREARELPGLCFVVLWTMLSRLTASGAGGFLKLIRTATLVFALIGCVWILAWSLCYFQLPMLVFPHCHNRFHTSNSDL